MDKIKAAGQMADLIASQLRKQIAAVRVLHPMEQQRIREIVRYQIFKYLKALQEPKSGGT